jgi:hypothetical protein
MRGLPSIRMITLLLCNSDSQKDVDIYPSTSEITVTLYWAILHHRVLQRGGHCRYMHDKSNEIIERRTLIHVTMHISAKSPARLQVG